MQRVLQCSVCSDSYVPGTRAPKTMSCGHSFCAPCLHILHKDSTIKCPKCRTICSIPENNINSLPTNYTILEMLDSVCAECQDTPPNGNCSHCDKNVCDSCREVHMTASHSDISADYVTLKVLLQRLTRKLNIDQILNKITTRRDDVIKELTQIKDDQINIIEKFFNENVKKVKFIAQDDIEKILYQYDMVSDTLAEARALLDSIRKQQYSALNHDFISLKNEIKMNVETLTNFEEADLPTSMIKNSSNMDDLAQCFSDSIKLMIKSPSGADVTNHYKAPVGAPDYSIMKCKQVLNDWVDCPMDICINPITGDIIVPDHSYSSVHVYSESLEIVTIFTPDHETTDFCGPCGVACVGKQIYVSDCNKHRVVIIDPSLMGVEGVFGSYPYSNYDYGYLHFPDGLAQDASKQLYVCDSENHRIKVLTQNGKFVRHFGVDVFVDENPMCIAISPENVIAVTDTSGNLYMFTIIGKHIRTIPGKTAPHKIVATGVVFDGHGNLHVADMEGRVVVMSEAGEVKCFIGSEGEGRGELRKPKGLAITRNNNIIVCDTGNNRLQIFGI